MMNRVTRTLLAGAVMTCLLALVPGCGSLMPGKSATTKPYNVEVTLDESLKNSSVIVDLVGVNPSSLPRWEAYDMGKYWQERDPMRNDADKKVLNFVSGQSLSQTMPATDPQWEKWKSQGVTHLLVLADLPGAQTSRPGNQDARRQILVLDRGNWPRGTSNLKVLVQRSGIVVLTPTRARG